MPKRISVLVVDDEPLVGASIKRALEQTRRCAVRVATDGEAGLALAREQPPDVILLDMVMPRMTGADVALKLRADPATAGIPFLFLTGLLGKADVSALGGVIDGERYLAKPATTEEILEAIAGLLGPVKEAL